jgi:hypothetical protein
LKNQSFIILLAGLCCLSGAAWGASYNAPYTLEFGPYVGSGNTSNQATVRHASGYAFSLDRNFSIGAGLTLGPRIEFVNGFMTTRTEDSSTKRINSFDHRILAAGFKLGQTVGANHTFIQGAYLNAVFGRGTSTLTVSESAEKTFVLHNYENISGSYAAGEIGAWIPIKGTLGINVAYLTSVYEANQSAATGTSEGDVIDDEGKFFELRETVAADQNGLDDRIVLKSRAIKIGLGLGF